MSTMMSNRNHIALSRYDAATVCGSPVFAFFYFASFYFAAWRS